MIRFEYWLPDGLMDWQASQDAVTTIHNRLHRQQDAYMGWVDYPIAIDEALVSQIMSVAEEIRNKCTALVIIGIGGSYLGAKAGVELLRSPFANEARQPGMPKVYFAGHHLSSIYYDDLFRHLESEEVCLIVISKSGTTLEPAVIFDLFKQFMRNKYGVAEAAKRIYAITDAQKGSLREETTREGYTSFEVPDDIGGRYSVLTPVGLLPLAAAGIDITKILQGAKEAYHAYNNPNLAENGCYQYGVLRHHLQEREKVIEIFEVYDGKLRYFTEWLKQLFGESECKDGKGILPMSLQMSTDLHSMGQYLQQGRQNFFETVLTVNRVTQDIALSNTALTGTVPSLHALNEVVQQSAQQAHQINGTPYMHMQVEEISPESFGQLVYFFEKACAVSCYLTGVNPFDQPGVEDYKRNIKKRIKEV